jgi:hypothetical protein
MALMCQDGVRGSLECLVGPRCRCPRTPLGFSQGRRDNFGQGSAEAGSTLVQDNREGATQTSLPKTRQESATRDGEAQGRLFLP